MNSLIRKVALHYCRKFGFLIKNDEEYLRLFYRCGTGKRLNLDNPVLFNEKMQWLKIHNRKPLFTTMVDKCEAKKYVADKIGDQYVIKTLGVYDHFDDINFNELPNQFVLKTTHDQGGVIVVKDKLSFNRKRAKNDFERRLKRKFYSENREWPYLNVRPRIIAEEYMEDNSGQKDLIDYKFMCFNGEPKLLQVHRGRFEKHTQDFYDMDWNFLEIYQDGLPNSIKPLKATPLWDKMKELSKILAKDIPFLRVDWYIINDRIYSGELTFFDASGVDGFYPDKWDKILGDWIKLY